MHARVVCWLHVKRLLLLLLLPWLLLARLHRLPWNLIKNLCAMKLHFDVRTTVYASLCVCVCGCLYLSVPAARAAPKGRRRTKANAAWLFLILKDIYVYIAKCWLRLLAGNGNGQLPVHIIAIGAAHTALIEIHLMLQWQPSRPEMVTAKAIWCRYSLRFKITKMKLIA